MIWRKGAARHRLAAINNKAPNETGLFILAILADLFPLPPVKKAGGTL